MKDDLAVPRWMLIIPGLLVLISLAGTDWSRLSDMGAGYVAALAGAVLVVGFNEEIMTRGILLTGFRRIGSETSAWAWSTGLFALMQERTSSADHLWQKCCHRCSRHSSSDPCCTSHEEQLEG
jgi:hypothetical protein